MLSREAKLRRELLKSLRSLAAVAGESFRSLDLTSKRHLN